MGELPTPAHGWLAGKHGDDGTPFRSDLKLNTDRVHLLIHETDRDPRHIYHWHRIRAELRRALQDPDRQAAGRGRT